MDTFFGFCSDFADTGKTENTENAGNTHYTHLKDQFFCVHMYCSMLMQMFFKHPFLKEPKKQDDIKGVSEVCGLGLCAVYFGVFLFPRFYG